MNSPVNVFWFRRDLRLNDNHGLFEALRSGLPILPVFIFDSNILEKLPEEDLRVAFIYNRINTLNTQLEKFNRKIAVFYGKPEVVFAGLISEYSIESVYTNHDYEPYALERDNSVSNLLKSSGIAFKTFKDQVLFEAGEIQKSDGTPYVVFTPYSKKWLEKMNAEGVAHYDSESILVNLLDKTPSAMPTPAQMGFSISMSSVYDPEIPSALVKDYAESRNFPDQDKTTRLGVHLRFGTISVRECINEGRKNSLVWLNELIWREFFMQILAHYPKVVNNAFRSDYDRILWVNNEDQFKRWCEGTTGYPLVDAGMRELSQTGFMHNRVRMVVASFLTKHLLIDWRWGEAWFAEKLMDFELSSNNGNWQWAAGTGCDAAPYFRIFNPYEQAKKFDKNEVYIRRWVPEYKSAAYPSPIVDHQTARIRCLEVYKTALKA
ncbi:MAG: deoxyribodipyrimidine photo-lyase [Lentimicrobium sp.]|nr:deoxyribodipyrimidine photo-lyase [Lentimicrobium sp.]